MKAWDANVNQIWREMSPVDIRNEDLYVKEFAAFVAALDTCAAGTIETVDAVRSSKEDVAASSAAKVLEARFDGNDGVHATYCLSVLRCLEAKKLLLEWKRLKNKADGLPAAGDRVSDVFTEGKGDKKSTKRQKTWVE